MKKIARLIGFYLNVLAVVAPRIAGRKGFYLFCTPLATPVKEHHRQFLDTAVKSSVEFEGITIQTYRWGNGPKKILFLHGWQSHSFRWKNYIDSFSKEDYTLYALDAPAHGLSGGKYINLPIYSRVIEHFLLRIHPLHAVIGHSFGGFASLYALYCNPLLPVERLVIMGTPGEADDFVQFYRGMLGLSSRAMRVIADYFEETLHHPPGFFSAVQFAKAVTVPGLIIHDEKDEEAPYRYALQIHAAWKTSKLITTSGLGHNLKSAQVVGNVMDFLSVKESVGGL
jgi:pimeloyl-ACP methyl ester carboxylesterase